MKMISIRIDFEKNPFHWYLSNLISIWRCFL